ncbi:hypothetical protein VNO80_29855 [Phaseolus coccineus]|uniref:Bromo domain-containing protein n=1 Tax=Phaseolus coccineus TaxID=3886 RepID=A0AAN9QIX1_PHACN
MKASFSNTYFGIYTGSKKKHAKILDEVEYEDRRRSSRIVALEKKKQLEKERKLAIALENKNKSINDVKNKGKGKAKMEVWEDFSDFNNEEGPTKKKRKNKEFSQLISSIKEIARKSQKASSSGTGTDDLSLTGMPLKNILEIVIDFLQRRDMDELFAEPINPTMVENYYEIVKQPMDFATMRTKLHEGMYTDLEQFKSDIFLICSNATSVYPERSKYHEVAEDINRYAKWTFEALSVDPQHPHQEFSERKKRPNRKSQKGKQKNPRRVAPKQSESTNSTEAQKRDLYWPPNNPLFSDVLDATKKANIQVNANTINYKESLMQFVKGLGPVAEKVAAKKLAALQDQPLNINENVSRTHSMHQPTPKAPTNSVSFNANTLPLSSSLLNRPFTILGPATRENISVNTNNVDRVLMGDRPHQRNKISTNENWHAYAASLLSNIFFENGKGGSSSANETMDARTLSKGKMVAPVEDVSSLFGPVQQNYNIHKWGVNNSSSNNNNNTIQWNTATNMPNMFSTGSSSSLFGAGSFRNVPPIVHPTRVISGPQPRPRRPISLSSGGFSMMQQPGIENTMTLPSNSLPMYQSMQEIPTSCISSQNITQSSHVRQPRPNDIINLADLRLRPQSEARDSMYGRPSNNFAEVSLMQERHQPWPSNSMSSLNPSMLSPLYQPMQGESVPCKNLLVGSTVFPSPNAFFSNDSNNSLYGLGTSHQPMDFQAMIDSQDFINDTWPMNASYEEVMHQAATFTPVTTQGFPEMQMQTVSQLNPHVLDPPQPNSASSP